MSAATMNEMDNLRKAAEILIEKNDAANEKNRQLMVEVEGLTKERDAAIEREQALWETLIKIGEELGIDYEASRTSEGKPSDVYINYIAIRDLIKQAEALEGMSKDIKAMHPKASPVGIGVHVGLGAKKLRQRAANLDAPR